MLINLSHVSYGLYFAAFYTCQVSQCLAFLVILNILLVLHNLSLFLCHTKCINLEMYMHKTTLIPLCFVTCLLICETIFFLRGLIYHHFLSDLHSILLSFATIFSFCYDVTPHIFKPQTHCIYQTYLYHLHIFGILTLVIIILYLIYWFASMYLKSVCFSYASVHTFEEIFFSPPASSVCWTLSGRMRAGIISTFLSHYSGRFVWLLLNFCLCFFLCFCYYIKVSFFQA